jgi:preprotein translocase subunit SecG
MENAKNVILALHLAICVGLVGLVLMQRSEGGALGMGGGGGGGLISGRGAADMLARITTWLAAAFFLTSLALTMLAHPMRGKSIFDRPQAPVTSPAPVGTPNKPPVHAAPIDAAVAPSPADAAVRAAPLESSEPIGASSAPIAASLPGAPPRPAPTPSTPIGATKAAPASSQSVGAVKAAAKRELAPQIPLGAAPAVSAQPTAPARNKAGPDE